MSKYDIIKMRKEMKALVDSNLRIIENKWISAASDSTY